MHQYLYHSVTNADDEFLKAAAYVRMSARLDNEVYQNKIKQDPDTEKDKTWPQEYLWAKKQPLFTSNTVLFSPFTTGPKCPQGGCFETRYVHKKVRAGCAAKSGSKFDNYCSSQKRQRGTCLCIELIREICWPQKI